MSVPCPGFTLDWKCNPILLVLPKPGSTVSNPGVQSTSEILENSELSDILLPSIHWKPRLAENKLWNIENNKAFWLIWTRNLPHHRRSIWWQLRLLWQFSHDCQNHFLFSSTKSWMPPQRIWWWVAPTLLEVQFLCSTSKAFQPFLSSTVIFSPIEWATPRTSAILELQQIRKEWV